MIKPFCVVLALSGSLLAATLTTVTQNVVNPDGTPASGQATIKINGSCQSASDYVGLKTITEKFTAGAFSVQLVSNDGGCIGTSYSVAWALTGGPTWQETWVVPYSATPLSVNSVKISSASISSPRWARGTFSISVTQPLITDNGLFQYTDQYPYGIASVACSTDTGSVTINLDIRSPDTPNTAGAAALSTPLVCSAAGTVSTSMSPAVPVPGNAPVALDVLEVEGTPNVVRIFVQKSAQ